ncbi:unnamed protein product [Pleuronectes platessa]|uniref:Uncharacterized protein n=1 Tax=Pleuronectes platessa TaxID=8262 RepID=A0A9N7VKC9_PLEPL|nr:unnamed protein product [Pleuronectes platessa]
MRIPALRTREVDPKRMQGTGETGREIEEETVKDRGFTEDPRGDDQRRVPRRETERRTKETERESRRERRDLTRDTTSIEWQRKARTDVATPGHKESSTGTPREHFHSDFGTTENG